MKIFDSRSIVRRDINYFCTIEVASGSATILLEIVADLVIMLSSHAFDGRGDMI